MKNLNLYAFGLVKKIKKKYIVIMRTSYFFEFYVNNDRLLCSGDREWIINEAEKYVNK